MKFNFNNVDQTATFLIKNEPSFATNYPQQPNAVQFLKNAAVKKFETHCGPMQSTMNIADGVLQSVWRGAGVTFQSVSTTSAPTDNVTLTVKTSLPDSTIIEVDFWVMP